MASDERAMVPATDDDAPDGDRYMAPKAWRGDVLAMLKSMKAEGLLPKGMTEQSAFLLVTRGRELGMQPMEALYGLYIVNGRVAMEGEAMLSVVNRNNLGTYKVLQATPERAQVDFVNRTGSTFTATFSIEDAARAKLSTDVWQKYPQMMLLWRAVSWGCRVAFPELFNGLYTREEAEAMEPVSVQYTVTETPPPAAEPRFLAVADILAMQWAANVPAAVLADVVASMGFKRDTVPTKLSEELRLKLLNARDRLQAEARAAEVAEVEPAPEPPANPPSDEEADLSPTERWERDHGPSPKPEDGTLL